MEMAWALAVFSAIEWGKQQLEKNCRIDGEDNDAAFVKLDSFISNVVLTFNDKTV